MSDLAITEMSRRISELEASLQRLERNEGRWAATSQIHPVSTNLSNIREMLLLEIIREKGLLDGVDIDAVAKRVEDRYAAENVPWGASQKAAIGNLNQALKELVGDYSGSLPLQQNQE